MPLTDVVIWLSAGLLVLLVAAVAVLAAAECCRPPIHGRSDDAV